jgi:hypothetical protein
MTNVTLKMALIIGVLSVLLVGVSGCTSTQNLITGGQASPVNAYANGFVNSTKTEQAPGCTVTGSNIVANGSNAVQLTMTIKNTTPTSIWANGSTYTYALNIKQFDNTNDASSFYNSTSFGYSQGTTNSTPTSNNSDVYQQVMGHAPTISRSSTQITSESLFGASVNIAMQQDEFVIYGTAAITGS